MVCVGAGVVWCAVRIHTFFLSIDASLLSAQCFGSGPAYFGDVGQWGYDTIVES